MYNDIICCIQSIVTHRRYRQVLKVKVLINLDLKMVNTYGEIIHIPGKPPFSPTHQPTGFSLSLSFVMSSLIYHGLRIKSLIFLGLFYILLTIQIYTLLFHS